VKGEVLHFGLSFLRVRFLQTPGGGAGIDWRIRLRIWRINPQKVACKPAVTLPNGHRFLM
jgi:hypothetical protein